MWEARPGPVGEGGDSGVTQVVKSVKGDGFESGYHNLLYSARQETSGEYSAGKQHDLLCVFKNLFKKRQELK